MENQPSPLNAFFGKEEISPTINPNIPNQNDIINSKGIINTDDSIENQLKKSNFLIKKDIDLDISQEENDIVDENDILNNLKNRFNDKIYFTKVNKDLIYINPLCNEDDIFGKEIKSLFRPNNDNEIFIENGKNIINEQHLFKTINQTIMDLKKNKYNKCSILLQGESYSGKSKLINESIKYLMNYFNISDENLTEANVNNINIENNFISNVTNKNYRTMTLEEGYYSIDTNKINLIYIPKKIIAALTILEAFGNAKNERNDNSTRSINYIKIRINKNCNKIIGMEILPFLFDKNRISNLGEIKGYNYNIFYYLLKCEDNDLLSKLFLSNDSDTNSNYLKGNENLISNNDSKFNESGFNELKESLITLGFTNDEILTIFKILSSIILLGNIELNIDPDFKSSLNQNEILLNVCNLLNIDINEFVSSLVNQENFNINIRNEDEEIEQTKNNFVNELYYQLFLWIINKINNNINNIIPENDKEKTIIFLDFPGYENNFNNISFNSLEQLFINYTNELIYYFYLKDINDDNINNDIINKKDVLNTINYLFKEMKSIQNDKQMKKFINNFIKDIRLGENSKRKYSKIKNEQSLIKISTDGKYFTINHSIGDVSYNINSILIKNIKNFIPWNLLDCLLKSRDPKIRNIYKNSRKNILTNNGANSENKSGFNNSYSFNYDKMFNNSFITFSEEYKNFVKEIKKEIKPSKRKYIICLKNNPNDEPLEFQEDYISQKLIFYKISLNNKNNISNHMSINSEDDFTKINFDDFNSTYEIIINKYISKNNSLDKQKQLLEILNIIIYNHNNNGEDELSLEENFKFDEDGDILIKNELVKILDEEKKKIIGENEIEKKIMVIQAGIKSFIGKNKIKNFSSIYFFIQNSLRIICAKNKLNEIQKMKQFLMIQLKLFIHKLNIKENHISKNKIKENSNENINYTQKEPDINKINISENPIINTDKNNLPSDSKNIRKLLLEMNNNKTEEEKNQEEEIINSNDFKNKSKIKDKRISIITHENSESKNIKEKMNKFNLNKVKLKSGNKNNMDIIPYQKGIKIFQQKIFLNKIEQRKNSIKKIFNFSYTLLASKYYIQMRKEIKVIQKYLKAYFSRKKILENAVDNYIKKIYEKNKNDLDQKINDILFPYRKENINKKEIEYVKTLSKKNIDNDNCSDNKNINNKNNMSTSERYKEYKKRNQFFNIKNFQRNKIKAQNDLIEQTSKGVSDKKKNDFIGDSNKNKNLLIKNIPNLSFLNNNTSYINQGSFFHLNIEQINNYDFSHHYDNKIYLLSKIIDIDILTDIYDKDIYDELSWVKDYKKIYEYNLRNKTPIEQIYLSDTHTLLINNKGNIFLFGMLNKELCGIKSKNGNDNYLSADEYLENFNNDLYGEVKEAVLKNECTLLLNKQGKIYNFYDADYNNEYLDTSKYNNENSMINNHIIESNIQSIQTSGNMNLYLSKSNDVYIDILPKSNNININSNQSSSRLKSFPYQTNLLKIFLSKKVKIKSISCGQNFYILLSTHGILYSGGSNLYNELCTSANIKQRISPEEIYLVSNLNENIIQVSCGFKHVIILSEKYNVYGWGNNSFGQLFTTKKKKMDLIKLKSDKKIVQICAGFRSSFLLDDKNEIYFFGIVNRNKKNNGGNMEKIFIEEKNNEFGNKNFFIPVKINAKWNKLFSIFYVNFADLRNISVKIEDLNHKYEVKKIKYILNMISSKWLINSVKLPYIKEINQYFTEDYMEKPDKIQNEVFY